MSKKNLIKKIKELEFKEIKTPNWYNYNLESAKSEDGKEFLKKGIYLYYKENDGFRCFNCDSQILGYGISHPVSRSIKMNLGLTIQIETVPYCPLCEDYSKIEEGKEITFTNEPGLKY